MAMNTLRNDLPRVLPLTHGLIAALGEATRLSGAAYALIPLQQVDDGTDKTMKRAPPSLSLAAAAVLATCHGMSH